MSQYGVVAGFRLDMVQVVPPVAASVPQGPHNTALSCEARLNEDGARSAPTNKIPRFVSFSALFGRRLLPAKHTLGEEVRDRRGKEYAHRQEDDTASTPGLVQACELDEQIRKVRSAVSHVRKDG